MGPDQLARIRNTGVPKDFLRDVGTAISTIPDGFNPHRMIKKVFEQRRGMVEEREDVDWGMAELLAFGTLLAEGVVMFLPLRACLCLVSKPTDEL